MAWLHGGTDLAGIAPNHGNVHLTTTSTTSSGLRSRDALAGFSYLWLYSQAERTSVIFDIYLSKFYP